MREVGLYPPEALCKWVRTMSRSSGAKLRYRLIPALPVRGKLDCAGSLLRQLLKPFCSSTFSSMACSPETQLFRIADFSRYAA